MYYTICCCPCVELGPFSTLLHCLFSPSSLSLRGGSITLIGRALYTNMCGKTERDILIVSTWFSPLDKEAVSVATHFSKWAFVLYWPWNKVDIFILPQWKKNKKITGCTYFCTVGICNENWWHPLSDLITHGHEKNTQWDWSRSQINDWKKVFLLGKKVTALWDFWHDKSHTTEPYLPFKKKVCDIL